MSEIQLKGECKLGADSGSAVSYANNISSVVISTTRNSVTRPATLGTGRESVKAGTISETVTINFISELAAASVWAELYDAVLTDEAELYFECLLDEGALGADNPQWAGDIVILSVDTGADVGSLRQQSQTFPVTFEGLTKTTE